MGLIPRQITPDDPMLAQVHALIHRSFAPMETRINPPSSVHQLTQSLLQEQATKGEVWAIGTPPAACMILTFKPGILYLGKLSTAAHARRKGHAKRLIEQAITRAKAHDVPLLEVQSRVELTENHALFQALGFVEVNRTAHPGFTSPTSITFRRPAK